MTALAEAFYTPKTPHEELAAFGLTIDDYETVTLEIWPDMVSAVTIFQMMATQWRIGMNGVTGLDYNCLPWLMKVYAVDDEASTLNDIRIMENAALRVIHRK
ncbi:TPA: DUF1799 domain-containing protein [Serratia marcescens]|uniref:DUF1799 domain-containing protein n=2 Tax=Serratia TaxID=613 RepID=UPI0009B4965C|nr:DUF1799 domain-containing protein [Serratia marcescens]ELY1864556.1 DUF1799 domain-containing protein [Serratia marcescens]MBN5321928.1 DUF1799 domain-containing protein [Serratia marcescens]